MSSNGILGQVHRDHERVVRLMDRIERAEQGDGAPERRSELFAELRDELIVLYEAEERTLYAAMARHDGSRDRAVRSTEQHNQIDELLEELDSMSPDDPRWAELFGSLRELFGRHVAEEESELFEIARRQLGEQHLEHMAEEFSQAKAQVEERLLGEDSEELDSLEQWSKDQLYQRAQELGIRGRSKMTKKELISAVRGSV